MELVTLEGLGGYLDFNFNELMGDVLSELGLDSTEGTLLSSSTYLPIIKALAMKVCPDIVNGMTDAILVSKIATIIASYKAGDDVNAMYTNCVNAICGSDSTGGGGPQPEKPSSAGFDLAANWYYIAIPVASVGGYFIFKKKGKGK